ADAPVGPTSVTVTNADDGGSTTLPGAFTVSLPPVVNSASPQAVCPFQSNSVVSLSGGNFAAGATCTISPQYQSLGISLSGPCQVVSDQLISAYINTESDEFYRGPFPLVVTNPDGLSTTTQLAVKSNC